MTPCLVILVIIGFAIIGIFVGVIHAVWADSAKSHVISAEQPAAGRAIQALAVTGEPAQIETEP